MEKTKSKNPNPQSIASERRRSISELKKKLGLDKIPVIHKTIPIKKDGKHLYYVAGFNLPLRPETLERLNIPNQRIICEIDRDEWHREMNDAAEQAKQETIDLEQYPWGYEP